MINRNNLKNLGEITSQHNFVLVDTCALFNCLNRSAKKGFSKYLENNHNNNQLCCMHEMLDFLEEDYPIYITPFVYDETYESNSYHIKKQVKKAGDQGNRKLLDYRRGIEKVNKTKRKLANRFSDEGKIIKLDEKRKSVYEDFYEKYSDLFIKYNLSECDADLLISARALAKTDTSSALISNDFGIFGAWKDILRNEYLRHKSFGFYARIDEDKFKRF